VFDVPAAQLVPWLYATVITGAILVLIEAFRACDGATRPRRVRVDEADPARCDSLPVGRPGADSVCRSL